MNGETKSYRMNDPMSWAEFRGMPDDLKINYVKAIRNKYGVSDTFMAKHLFKVNQTSVSQLFRRLGVALGRGSGQQKADKEAFLAWCNGVPMQKECSAEAVDAVETEVTEAAEETEVVQETVCNEDDTESRAPAANVPVSGTMTFRGNAASALRMVMQLLGDAESMITVSWKSRMESNILERMVDDGK